MSLEVDYTIKLKDGREFSYESVQGGVNDAFLYFDDSVTEGIIKEDDLKRFVKEQLLSQWTDIDIEIGEMNGREIIRVESAENEVPYHMELLATGDNPFGTYSSQPDVESTPENKHEAIVFLGRLMNGEIFYGVPIEEVKYVKYSLY